MIPRLTRFALLALGDRLVAAAVRGGKAEAFVVDAEQPVAALRAELEARRLAPRRVAIGLARSAVTVKPVEFPPVAGDPRDMVRFELDRHLPFPADDAAFDFTFLPVEGKSASGAPADRRVLVVAADRRVVEGALRIADEAKLRAISVTVAAHELLGLVTLDSKSRVVWVHRGEGSADLLFVHRGRLVLSRSVAVTGDEDIGAEIRRSFIVLRWRGCDAVWLSGDGASVGGPLPAGLAALATVSAPPYTAASRRLLGQDFAFPRALAELAVAVAAGPRTRTLDLLPVARRPRRLTKGQWLTVATATATIVLALTALLYPGYRSNRHLGRINRNIERLTPEVRAVERVQADVDRRRKLLAMIDGIEATAVRPLPVLRELTELLPADAWVTSLSLDAKGVELTGQAAAASTLIPLLENSSRLERVEFSSPVTRGRDKEQFRIRASWEATAKPAPAAPAAPGAPPRARQDGGEPGESPLGRRAGARPGEAGAR